MNEAVLVAVPPGVVTEVFPFVADDGTTAVTLVALTGVKLAGARSLKLTAVAPVRFVPVMVTVAPALAANGVKLVIVGAGITVKSVELDAVPPAVVTEIGPVTSAAATTAVILVELTTVKLAALTPPI